MQLGARIFGVSTIALALVSGCASSCPAPAATAPQAPVVSTTRLTSAELPETDFAPLVGKPQHASSSFKDDDAADPKDGHKREGGGFSGYK